MLGGDTPVDAVHRLLVAAIESGDHRYDAADPELINALWTLALVLLLRREAGALGSLAHQHGPSVSCATSAASH